MTDSDLTKYDWRWRLGDGGSSQYLEPPTGVGLYHLSPHYIQPHSETSVFTFD